MLIVSILAVFTVMFLLISIMVVVAWMALRRVSEDTAEQKLWESEAGQGSPLFKTERLSTISIWQSLLARFDFIEIMKTRIAEADLNWSVGRVTSLMLLCGTVVLAILINLSWVPLWAALLAGGLATLAPYSYILRRRTKRFRKLQEQLPDALDSLARALRAGYPFSAAMDMVASESPAPVSAEMLKTSVEANLGMPWNQVLANLARRVPLLEVNLFVAAVQLHSRTGGKLSEVMGSLSENMRESTALQGEVRAIAAHGKLTGVILTLVPIAIMGIMFVVNPMYVGVLLGHPYGKHLIAAAVCCLILAQFVIQKIVDIKI